VFYVLIFSLAAIVLIIGGVASMKRRQRRGFETDATRPIHGSAKDRHNTKAKRAQSQQARRKRR
jgi:hypothetical protein